jgi:hypothetical protein
MAFVGILLCEILVIAFAVEVVCQVVLIYCSVK